ncbi:hypothetical protein B0H13DRAFT_1526471, partial [Mycena leptocephala]
PFAHTTSRLEIIPSGNGIERRSRLRGCGMVWTRPRRIRKHRQRHTRPLRPQRVFSNDIWLGHNCGESAVFAKDVQISGWTSVGMPRASAWGCVMKTKEGTLIHAHKRYSDFVAL